MVKFYAAQIRLGKMTLAQVPDKYKEQVKKELQNV